MDQAGMDQEYQISTLWSYLAAEAL